MKIHRYVYQRDDSTLLHLCHCLDDDGDSRQDEDCATPPPGERYMYIVYILPYKFDILKIRNFLLNNRTVYHS